MPPALQAKLLRALESGEVRRIGENESRRVDVRFVTATNVDLKAAVDTASFRNDLYYRVNVHRVHMPPLRERDGDVPLLVEHFLERYGRAGGVTGVRGTGDGRAAGVCLSRQRAATGTHHPARGRDRAAARARRWTICPRSCSQTATAVPASEGTVTAARERAERDMIVATLARCTRRDCRHRPRVAGQPHDHVAADEEARHRILNC